MLLKEIMTPQVETVDSTAPVRDVARRMKELDVGILPVVGTEGVDGVVTDRDIVVRGVAEERDPVTTAVKDVMTDQALSMTDTTPVEDAVTSMEQQQVRRLLVIDAGKRVVGIVSLGDLAVRGGKQIGGEVLQKISDPTQPDRPSPSS